MNNENKAIKFEKNNFFKKLSNKKLRYLDEKKDKSEINIISKNSWWKNKLGEFYKKDYDDMSQGCSSFIGSKIDGVTFKLYSNKSKYKNLLSKREKEMFSIF